jgi:hypothetical protein
MYNHVIRFDWIGAYYRVTLQVLWGWSVLVFVSNTLAESGSSWKFCWRKDTLSAMTTSIDNSSRKINSQNSLREKNSQKKCFWASLSMRSHNPCTTTFCQCRKKITTRFLGVNCNKHKLRHRVDYSKFLGSANLQFRQVLSADPWRTQIDVSSRLATFFG